MLDQKFLQVAAIFVQNVRVPKQYYVLHFLLFKFAKINNTFINNFHSQLLINYITIAKFCERKY